METPAELRDRDDHQPSVGEPVKQVKQREPAPLPKTLHSDPQTLADSILRNLFESSWGWDPAGPLKLLLG